MANTAYEDWGAEEEEFVPINIPTEYRTLNAEETHITVRDLFQRYLSQEIVLEPDFQRHYVWDSTRASRYIESLLLGLPTPPLFLSEERKGQWVVIDGHQRLETLFRFMQPLLAGPIQSAGKQSHYQTLAPLNLSNLEVMPELNAKGVTALSGEDRAKLWDTLLGMILLPVGTDPRMKYVLFARLNQGSMSLNAQELRNCLYRGSYNRLIGELSEDHNFLALWKRKSPDKRMRHRELTLRVFALLHRRERYQSPFRNFLNEEMIEHREASQEELKRFRQEFNTSLTWTDRILGPEGFRLFSIGTNSSPAGRWLSRRYDLVYELEMVGFAHFMDQLNNIWDGLNGQEQMFKMAIRRRLISVMINPQFRETLNEGTTRPTTIVRRFTLWYQAIEDIINNPEASMKQSQALHNILARSNVCSVCPNQVSSDDALLGANGNLMHRFCLSAPTTGNS